MACKLLNRSKITFLTKKMAKYEFKPCNEKNSFQLFRERWLRADKPLDVYLTLNPFGKYDLVIKEKDCEISSNFISVFDAARVVGYLRDKGVSKTDLQNARIPDDNAMNCLGAIVSGLAMTEGASKS